MQSQIRIPVVIGVLLLAGCLDKAEDIPTSAATASPASDAAITLNGTPPAEVTEDSAYFFQPLITQSGLGAVSYAVSGQPAWMTFDSATGALGGSPTAADVGTTGEIVITATSASMRGSVGPFRVRVKRKDAVPVTNTPPTISGTPSTMVTAGNAYRFAPTATDANGSTLTFAITNKPAWASFSTSTGVVAGTPGSADVGTYAGITISVSDAQATTSLPAFAIQVLAANRAPTIAGTPAATVTAGQAYRFTPTATDADNDPLTFSISNKPAWASFSTTTGALTGTPGSTAVGSYSNIIISVGDGNASVALQPFAIQVVATAPSNAAPTIAGTPPTTVAAGSGYLFTPTAADANQDPLSFSVQNKPVWAAFSTSNGSLSGAPTSAQVGTYSNIVIAVSDGKASAALAPFSIQVTSVNRAPSISGTPGTAVAAGAAYSFTPTATDADGDPLSFSIANKPAWASFNTATGALTGTPTSAQAGSYAGITITVSDGRLSTSLPAFAVAVTAPSTGSASLNWTAPTQNDDGTPLTNLAGYRIAYGNNANSLNQVVDINNPSSTSYTISGLSSGTWYFSIRSYTSAGVESIPSNAASKTL